MLAGEQLKPLQKKYKKLKQLFLSHLWHSDKVLRMLWDTDLGGLYYLECVHV